MIMDETRFPDEMRPVLDAMRKDRGACPQADRLIAFDDLDEAERDDILRHTDVCPTCAAVVRPEESDLDDLSWQRAADRLDARPKPWLENEVPTGRRSLRRPLLIAATLVIALAAATLWRQTSIGPGIPDRVSSQRGASIQAVEPSGSIASVGAFRWRTVLPIDLVYRVELETGGTTIWSAETTENELDPPSRIVGELDTGRIYRWRVLGFDREVVIAESDWTEFTLTP